MAYRWLADGLEINCRTLAGFRTGHGEFLSQLLTQTVATLTHAGVVSLNRMAQDGLRAWHLLCVGFRFGACNFFCVGGVGNGNCSHRPVTAGIRPSNITAKWNSVITLAVPLRTYSCGNRAGSPSGSQLAPSCGLAGKGPA
ncbi:hypothetical protein [Zavarzinella formosa]|uniref:hypothetical protein n=1 Tax=Zavarzinella formosa TaxID=360055 RepID=UPI000319E201|nr:hypothetical protein [Zavarzinella formosa]